MNINLSIDTLVIDEGVIKPQQRYEFKALMIKELQQLLSGQEFNSSDITENNNTVVNGGEIMIGNNISTTLKAQQLARQVYSSLYPSRNQGVTV